MNVKVGDKIYFFRYSSLVGIQTVLKITPTGIIKTKHYSLREERSYLHIITRERFNTTVAKLETPELKAEWELTVARRWLNEHLDDLSLEDIEPLMEKYKG